MQERSKTSMARTLYSRQGYRVSKLGNPGIGAEFEVNDHRGVIVGIAKVATSSLFGVPTLYTTYERALYYIPIRDSLSRTFSSSRRITVTCPNPATSAALVIGH